MITKEQLKVKREMESTYDVVRTHHERFKTGRLFIWIDDHVSSGSLDNITHEVQVFPDGKVLGETPGNEEGE